MVKIVPIIEAGHAVNATQEDGNSADTFIGDREKFWDIITPFLSVIDAWTHVKSARKNCNGRKATLAFYDNLGGRGQTTWITSRTRKR